MRKQHGLEIFISTIYSFLLGKTVNSFQSQQLYLSLGSFFSVSELTNYHFFSRGTTHEKGGHINLGGGLFNWKLEVQNFEIAIMFKIF